VEKLLYSLWKVSSVSGDEFRDELLLQLAPKLTGIEGVHGLRICVVDSAVSAAAGRRIESHAPLPDAMLSLWVDFAGAAGYWEPLIDAHVSTKTVYLVAEAEPLVSQQTHPSMTGERLYGMCQVVFMSPPDDMDRGEWLSTWKDNLVVRRMTADTPGCFAVVEENFPPEAMASDHAFYATGGDEALLQKNMNAMIESCTRFIDFQKIDVIPMSEYLIKPVSSD
jgi:hypothetical protein